MDAAGLKEIDLFASLPDEEGEELLRAGTPPYQLFAIVEGTVDVSHDGEKLATLGPGEVLGEQGVLEHGLRNATAVANSPVKAVFLTDGQVRQLRRDNSEFDEKLRSILEERTE